MQITSKTITVRAGGLLATVTTDGTGRPVAVAAVAGVLDEHQQAALTLSLDAELVERLGQIVRELRDQNHDYRGCCADHGYYHGDECRECDPLLRPSDDSETVPRSTMTDHQATAIVADELGAF